jgi:hypothetical protein
VVILAWHLYLSSQQVHSPLTWHQFPQVSIYATRISPPHLSPPSQIPLPISLPSNEKEFLGARWGEVCTFLTAEGGAVHGFTEDFDGECAGLLQRHVILVILFQETLRRGIIGADGRGFPASVIARWIGLVELEPMDIVVPSIQK